MRFFQHTLTRFRRQNRQERHCYIDQSVVNLITTLGASFDWVSRIFLGLGDHDTASFSNCRWCPLWAKQTSCLHVAENLTRSRMTDSTMCAVNRIRVKRMYGSCEIGQRAHVAR